MQASDRQTDRQTDGQTNRITTARVRPNIVICALKLRETGYSAKLKNVGTSIAASLCHVM